MWPRWSHILYPLTEVDSFPKGRNIIYNNALEEFFKELKCMVSAETLLSYPNWKIPFTVHTDVSDKQLGAVIIHNNKPSKLLSRIPRNTQPHYTTTNKEIIKIVKCLKKISIITFGYVVNVFSDHKNMVYASTLSEYKRVMHW